MSAEEAYEELLSHLVALMFARVLALVEVERPCCNTWCHSILGDFVAGHRGHWVGRLVTLSNRRHRVREP